MGPALTTFDIAKVGAVLADMVVCFLAAGASPADLESANDPASEDCRPTSVATRLHLHTPVDLGAGALQSGEHRPPIQPCEQGPLTRLEPGSDPSPRPRSGQVGISGGLTYRLQDLGRRCGDGSRRGDLLAGSVAFGAVEPGLASPARAVRHNRHARDRRRWHIQSCGIQRRPRAPA